MGGTSRPGVAAPSGSDGAYTTITPRLGRMLLVELRSFLIGVAVGGAGLVLLEGPEVSWPWISVLICLGLLVLGAGRMRETRRITIADTWISGPDGGAETTVMEFGIVDTRRSSLTDRRLRLRTASGRGIDAKLAWYDPDDVEELRRLLRDRAGLVTPT